MVEKFARINQLDPSTIVSVGDSGPDLSMMIEGSSFVGFNPIRAGAKDAFTKAGVPVIESRDLREIWNPIFGEDFSNQG
jgi:phosphoserine phosphatase